MNLRLSLCVILPIFCLLCRIIAHLIIIIIQIIYLKKIHGKARMPYIIRMVIIIICRGLTLAQLVKASVGQEDVQRFEPCLWHN